MLSNLSDIVNNHNSIDSCYDEWKSSLMTMVKNHIPLRTICVKSSDKPWITREVKQKIRKRDQLFRKFKRKRTLWYEQCYINARYQARKAIDEAKMNHLNKLTEKLSAPDILPKDFWQINKQLLGTKHQSRIPAIQVNNKTITDAQVKAQSFNNLFASHSKEPANDSLDANHVLPRVNCFMNTFVITEEETKSVISKLNSRKANGPDNISNLILKNICDSITPSLTKLMNLSLTLKQYPQEWKSANVVPIHKKGDNDIKNYRPISLLSNVSKIMERIVYNRLYMYLMRNNLLTWRNSGYKKSDGTTNQLVNIVHEIYNNMDYGLDTCMVYLDESKAFDRVWHKGLL